MTALLRFLCWSTIAALAIACGGGLTKSAELRGYVRLGDGTPVSGVRMAASWPDDPELGSMQATTNADGYYRLWTLEPYWDHANWRHIAVTPELAGYTFQPATLDIFLAHDEQYADFTAVPTSLAQTTTLWIWWREGEPDGQCESGYALVKTAR
jgi:hypothetical protein